MVHHLYIIALGSNRRHGRYGAPAAVLMAALKTLPLIAASRIIQSRPIGPSSRAYSNAVAVIETDISPSALLACLKATERAFGRRRGRRWGARVLDLDIILWSGGVWKAKECHVPHPQFRVRDFVLGPMMEVAPAWRDPVTGFRVKQLKARIDRARPSP
jgi:2-amino-4-hydroxy-6-hydroxymethyldihydropteridine diphosphokinase